MKVVEIKSRGYNQAFDKFELIVLVKSRDGHFLYHRCLYDTAEEMYKVKEGDILP